MKDITGIVLAGGNSSRMGQDKGLLKVGNSTLIEKIVEELRPFVGEVLISTNQKERYSFLKDVRFVEDFRKGEGPLVGILSSLEASHTPWSFVVSCDLPFFQGALIPYLANRREGYGVIPIQGTHYEPLIAMYSRDCRPLGLTYLNRYNRKVSGFIDYLDGFGLVTKIEAKELCDRFGSKLFTNMNDQKSYDDAKDVFHD